MTKKTILNKAGMRALSENLKTHGEASAEPYKGLLESGKKQVVDGKIENSIGKMAEVLTDDEFKAVCSTYIEAVEGVYDLLQDPFLTHISEEGFARIAQKSWANAKLLQFENEEPSKAAFASVDTVFGQYASVMKTLWDHCVQYQAQGKGRG